MHESEPSTRRGVRSSIVGLLLLATLIVGAPAALLFLRQHAMIYYPRSYPAGFERALPPGTVQLEYTTAVGKQLAFYLPPPAGQPLPERLWVTFSGNASVALDWLFFAARHRNENDGFLLVDYPGYGRSEGRAGISSTRASANQALSTLAEQLRVSEEELRPRLCVIGVSLGAAAALEFAAGHPVQRAVLIAPFSSLRDLAAKLFTRPASYLLLESYDNRARLRELAERSNPPRVAIFHGTADSVIPASMGRELAESAPEVTQFFPIKGATHDTIVSDAMDQILGWMAE